MKTNMGSIDRIVRTVVALAAAILILTGTLTGLAAVITGVFAGVFLLTSSVSFCPLYTAAGVSTCRKESAK